MDMAPILIQMVISTWVNLKMTQHVVMAPILFQPIVRSTWVTGKMAIGMVMAPVLMQMVISMKENSKMINDMDGVYILMQMVRSIRRSIGMVGKPAQNEFENT